MCRVRSYLLCLLVFSSLLPFASLLHGQATSRLTGGVVDTTGAAVAGVEITVLNAGTGVERKLTTTEGGDFTFPSLPPGEYTVTATKQGFRRPDAKAFAWRSIRAPASISRSNWAR